MAQVTRLKSAFVHLQEDDEVVMVGFADREYDTRDYLMLQRTLSPTAEDIDLGMDDVHVSVNGQARSRYGGVRAIVVSNDIISIHFTEEAASDMEVAAHVTIDVSAASVDRAALLQYLEQVCDKYVEMRER